MLKVSDKESAFGALSKYANPALIPFESCAWERAVMKPVKKFLIDTNVILRCLLRDNEEQAQKADEVIKAGAWTLPEVLAEVEHVLRTVYNVERKDIAEQLFKAFELIKFERPDIMLRALEIFNNTRLDFVDCIIAAYHGVNKVEVFTFDKKLNNQFKREEK